MEVNTSTAKFAALSPISRSKEARLVDDRSTRAQSRIHPSSTAMDRAAERDGPQLRELAERRTVENSTQHYRDRMPTRVRRALDAYDQQAQYLTYEAQKQIHSLLGVDFYV